MADMYGAVRSNWFRVQDPVAFQNFVTQFVSFGSETALLHGNDPDVFAFGGYEQYPNAWPRIPVTDENPDDDREWDLVDFATAMRMHLAKDEEFRVLAAGNEKLRYVAATHLIIKADGSFEFNDYYEGN